MVDAEGAPSGSDRPVCSFRAPIRLSVPLMPSGNPERQDAHCAPRSYGDSVGCADGGGVRRGFSVGDGVGVGVGVGSAVALGDGSTEGEGEGEGSGGTVGAAESDGTGVITGSGVAETTELGRGVAGSADWTAGTDVVGVSTGAMVARCPVNTGSCVTNCDAANTNAAPRRATATIVAIKVAVVRIAPRITCVRRSDSHEWWEWRSTRSSRAARRILSSRAAVDRGTGSEPRSAMTSVPPPISTVQAAQPLT